MGRNIPIRHRLLLAAAFAIGAVWIGAFLQYRELAAQEAAVAVLRSDLDLAQALGRVSVATARERGQTAGWMGAAPDGRALRRTDVDAARTVTLGVLDALPKGLFSNRDTLKGDLQRLRAAIDEGRIDAATAFAGYSALIADLNLEAAQRLAGAMLGIGIPYEHLNGLREGIEFAGQTRGLVQGHLLQRGISPAELQAVRQRRTMSEFLLHRSAALAPQGLPALSGARWQAFANEWQRFDAAPVDYVESTSPDRWWSVATVAIDALQADLDERLGATITEAETRLAELGDQARWALATMAVLGVITLLLLGSSLVRVVRGLSGLVDGIERVATKGDLKARIDTRHADEFGRIGESVNHLVDSLEQLIAEKEARADTDALTGLPNRAGLDRHLASKTNPARRHREPFGLLIVDIDHFKSINDRFGHPEGDRVLSGVAAALKQAVRPDDLVGRWGGEEFLVILSGGGDVELTVVAEKLRATVAGRDFGLETTVTISVGATIFTVAETLDAAFARADAALYAAKHAGRNRVIVA